ncbi:Uma2 family endonuclease [Tautonia rosea]|uniref:Uma2 family endonuclease n=1 Tax=Tautonia rosea TaxID=2728037 RepID=UPI0014765219|nr:Uma2 family endonuclease [Tautonia rosea]
MSVASSSPPAGARGGRPYLITAEDYARMIECGAIPEGRRVELWEGQLVEKMTKKPPHVIAQGKLADALFRIVPEGWHVQVECPLGLGPLHVPEPDLMIVRGARDDYASGHPTPADVSLVVEVADTSVAKDLGRMQSAYAAGGVVAYWVVNLRTRTIEAHADPIGGETPEYRSIRSFGEGESIPLTLDGRFIAELPVASLLPAVAG